jgi:hypothetical protein
LVLTTVLGPALDDCWLRRRLVWTMTVLKTTSGQHDLR